MKNILFLAALICGAELFAVDPVAVWNGDFTTKTKGDYTLAENGNTVAADGSSITISAAKGVTFERSSALANTVGMTVVYKFDNLIVGSTVKTIGTASAGGGNADRIGVNVQTSGQTSGIWANTGTYNTSATQTMVSSVESNGQFALVYGPSVSNNTGTFLYLKTGSADYALAYSCGGLKGSSDTVLAMTVGGTRNNGGTFPAASGMVIKAVALFDQALTQAQIAEYVFPEPTKKVEPVMLVNFGYTTAEAGWYNHTQSGGNSIGTLTTNNVSFLATKNVGNFFNVSNSDFGQVDTDWTADGTYTDIFGKTFTTVAEEVKSSLGLGSIPFTANVYKTGLMNGGYTDHEVTISGLDATAKYVVYAGFGMLRTQYNEQVMGVQFDASGYATVEALEYIVTVAGTGTTKESRYQSFAAGTQICPGTHGLMLTRLVNVQPKADGAIALTFKGAKGGINFLAVAKMNETTVYTTKEIAGGASISVSKINAEIEETNDKAEVTLPDGAVVTYDAALAVPTKFISSGAITLVNTTQPNLDKADFSGVAGIVKRDWVKKGFGFNFNNNAGGTTTIALENTTWKSDASGNNGTNVAMSEDGISKVTWTSNNLYTDQQNTGTILHGYLDDSAGVNITVSNIPFAEYAVIIYSTTDTENAKLSYKTVNGKNYTADGTKDVAKEGTEAWGRSRSSAAAAYGTNALRIVAQTSGSLVIHSANRSGARGCISAIQIVPYASKVAPSIDADFALVAEETTAEDYASGTVTLGISGVKENDYPITYTAAVNGLETPITGAVDKVHGTVSFTMDSLVPGTVYRGTITLTYDDGKVLATAPFAVHAGEQKFVWTTEGELWVNETATTMGTTGAWTGGIAVAGEKLVVNTASGVTFVPTANPDYIEKCDSTFTVAISASEAVDAASDPEPAADVQGGVRIASVGGVLKVQALADGAWADLKTSGVEVNRDYEVVVAFHYAKEGVEDDADSVSYTLDGVTVTGGKVANTVAKISSVEVADGTSLAFLKGVCQLDKAVVVDVEIDPGDEKPIEAKDLAAAQAIADKMVVAISEEVAKVVNATTYRGYFKVVARKGEDGKFHAFVEFQPGVKGEIEDDIKKAMATVVAGFETGSAEIAAKPGLYYGVTRGDALNDMAVRDPLTLAGADGKVTITITKPEKSNGHFYRLICTPTPAEEK